MSRRQLTEGPSIKRQIRRAFDIPLHRKRECGECTVCCTVRGVAPGGVFVEPKPAWTPCPHCSGTACGIYAERPPLCQVYECAWLIGLGAESDRPDRSEVLVDFAIHGEEGARYTTLNVTATRKGVIEKHRLPPWVARLFEWVWRSQEVVVEIATDPDKLAELHVPNACRENVLADPRVQKYLDPLKPPTA